MASTLKHLRSSTADKRPTASGLVDGQLAINTASGTPALFFKDNNGGVVKVGPAHVGPSAPNTVPAGSAGNSLGELWVDNSLTTPGLNYYTGSAFVNLTPSGTTSVVGLVELATNAETQTGSDAVRAVTPAGLQSKVSDSTSTTSSTTIASSTAVKAAYDLANAALPKTGGTITGELLIGNTGSLVFEGATDNTFETTIAVADPTADRTITFPDITGTVITTGDTGTVTSTIIANDTIVNADINSSAAIAYSKLASMTAGSILLGNASNVPTVTAITGDITISNTGVTAISNGAIVDSDVSASAAIAGTKIDPGFGSQNVTTTGMVTGASLNPTGATIPTNGIYAPATNTIGISTAGVIRQSISGTGSVTYVPVTVQGAVIGDCFVPTSSTAPSNGIYLPAANNVAISTNGQGKLFVDSSGRVGIGASSPATLLEVRSATTNAARLRVTGTGTTAGNFRGFEFGNGSVFKGGLLQDESTDLISIVTPASNQSLNINSSGSVGIGVLSASEKLHIDGGNLLVRQSNFTDASVTISQSSGTTSNKGILYFADGTGNTSAITGYGSAFGSGLNKALQLSTNGTAALTIDSSQRVGIGTQTPSYALTVSDGTRTGFVQPSVALGSVNFGVATNHPMVLLTNNQERLQIDTTGQIEAVSLGTAAAPVWSFTTDPNTGIYSPGADQVAISTNGAGRLFVSSTGQIGIGGTPGAPLHVKPGSGDSYINVTSVTSSASVIFNDSGTGGNYPKVGSEGNNLVLRGGSLNNAVTIDSSQRVGIGTSSPAFAVDISAANDTIVRSRTNGNTSAGFIGSTNNGTNNWFFGSRKDATGGSSGTDRFNLLYDTNAYLTVTTAGLIGVGTSSPGEIVDVSSSSYPLIRCRTNGNTSAGLGASTDNATNLWFIGARKDNFGGSTGTDRFNLLYNTNAYLTVTTAGNVGIGTTSPVSAFKATFSGDYGIRIQNQDANQSFINFGVDPGNGYAFLDTDKSGTGTALPMRFAVNAQERMRIDTSGRLLVGTTSAPTGSSSQYSKLVVRGNSLDNGGGYVAIGNGTAASSLTTGSDIANIYFIDGAGGQFGSIQCFVDAAPGTGDNPGRLVFSTTADGASSPTERMRIKSSGEVCIGTTSSNPIGDQVAGGRIDAGVNNFYRTAAGGETFAVGRAGDGNLFTFYRTGATQVGSISVTAGATAYNTSSDYRLKENVIEVADGIDRLQQLKPCRFNFIGDPGRTVDGFIAHEVQTVVPEAITGEKDAVDDEGNPIYQGIDQSKLVPLLTAALQEAIGRIETLEAEVAALKAQ